MSAYEAKHHSREHSWQALRSNPLRSQAASARDSDYLATHPDDPYWQARADKAYAALRDRIGNPLYKTLLERLPEEVNDWPAQKWLSAFERTLRYTDRLPLGEKPTIAGLLAAAHRSKLLSLYGSSSLAQDCPNCLRRTIPGLLSSDGYTYYCQCGNQWYHLDEAAQARWNEHVGSE